MSMQMKGGGRVGPKEPITAVHAVCSSQHPLATDAMLGVMQAGGSAVDAAVAGSLVHGTVQQEMTNHGGTVSFLYYEAKSGRFYDLDAMGTIVPGLAPFRPVPPKGDWSRPGDLPMAAIPGTMPGLKAIHERFGTRPWAELCEPAIRAAEEGHEVGSFEHRMLSRNVDFYLHTPSGRAHFAPNGHLPQAGDIWRKPELAKTLRALAKEGPDYFTTGEWGRQFVKRANDLGWTIEQKHMDAIPPRWGEGLRWKHRGREIVQLSPPQGLGVSCAIVLGVLEHLDISSLGHYTDSADALYYVAHAIRRAEREVGFLHDPEIFDDPTGVLLSDEFHADIAELLRRSRPKIDLTEHVEVYYGRPAVAAAASEPSSLGSCELSLVDGEGNWVQMMTTLQGGGIPGEVIGGVSMSGSHCATSLAAPFGGWFSGGGRMRSIIGHTFVLGDDGTPVWSLGTPGFPPRSVPQVLLSRLAHGMEPYAADDSPRMGALSDDFRLPIEGRVPGSLAADAARLGILLEPFEPYHYSFGSFQMSWRDEDGMLHASTGPRRAGSAAGY